MRVLVISDTHKKHENLKVVLERVSPVDLVIHLGDAEGYEDYIGELCGCPLEIVAGNNDFFSSLPREKEIMAGNYRVFMTHGHYYYVGSGIEDLKREALARGGCRNVRAYTYSADRIRGRNRCHEPWKYFLSATGGKTPFVYPDGH